jgi:hypothetical protein
MPGRTGVQLYRVAQEGARSNIGSFGEAISPEGRAGPDCDQGPNRFAVPHSHRRVQPVFMHRQV